jgi:carbon-monoxide dehydrogenase medium subunit
MKPSPFNYVSPDTLEEALRHLSGSRQGKVLAGGQSLLPKLISRQVGCDLLVDIKNIKGLDSIQIKDGHAVIGARVRQRDAELSSILQLHHPLMIHIISHIGCVAIRNKGTLIGSLCQGGTWGELPLLFTLLGGILVVHSLEGKRKIPAHRFFIADNCTVLTSKEIVTEAHFSLPPLSAHWGYCEYSYRTRDRALCLVGVVSQCDRHGRLVSINIAVGGVTAFPQRCRALELLLIGEIADKHLAEHAGYLATTQLRMIDDDKDVSVTYRHALLRTLLSRALTQSFSSSSLSELSR